MRSRGRTRGGKPVLVSAPPAGKFVASDASGSGDGSFNNPWTLAQAAANGSGAQPGDTVWMRNGTYTRTTQLDIACDGTSGAGRITFRSYPGERAHIQRANEGTYAVIVQNTIIVSGDYVTLTDIELSNDWVTRIQNGASWTPDGGGHCIDWTGLGGEIKNCLIHDVGASGIGAGIGTFLVYGNLAYNGGHHSTDSPHGLGTYLQGQNSSDAATAKHNVFANWADSCITAKASSSYVNNFIATENFLVGINAFNDTKISSVGGCGILIYDINQLMDSPSITNNVVWTDQNTYYGGDVAFSHSYGDTGADELTLNGNWMRGTLPVQNTMPITGAFHMKNNTIWRHSAPGGSRLVAVAGASPNAEPGTYDWDYNTWVDSYTSCHDPMFSIRKGGVQNDWYGDDFASYKTAIGATHDTLECGSASNKPDDETWLYANTYETGRANICVYNGNAAANTVNVDCDSVLGNGEAWWLYNAENPLAGAIASGTYTTGAGVAVPMTSGVAGVPATPVGTGFSTMPTKLPDFGVFVLRRVGPTWVAPPTALVP